MRVELESLLKQAGNVLSETFAHPVHLPEVTVLSDAYRRNRLVRIQVEGGPVGGPDSLIIKQAAPDNFDLTDPDSFAVQGIFNDWAALLFLSRLPGADVKRYAPKFYGGHREAGFILMEDLGSHTKPFSFAGETHQFPATLVQPLLQESAQAAHAGLLKLGKRLGQLHGATTGREAEYEQIRQQLLPRNESVRDVQASEFRQIGATVPDLLRELDIAVPGQLSAELASVAEAIANPGPFLVFTHGDPCPDNCAYFAGQLRLIDFEAAGYRHALLDAVYGRMAFPTCWCCQRVPAGAVAAMEQVYRAELVQGCPEAADDKRFGRGLVDACAYWTIQLLRTWPKQLEADQEWGISTLRQRVLARLEIMSETATEFNHLPVLADVTAEMAQRLRLRWSETAELPMFSSFASG